MRKKISTLLMTSAIILSALLIPTVLAEKPTNVSGKWSWRTPSMPSPPGFFNMIRLANGNMFIHADDDAILTGDFDGTGYDVFTMTVHPKGFATGSGRTVFTGKVLGKEGTLVIMWVGNTKNDWDYWRLKWVIISGTGELANLRGQGTAWGPGPAGPGVWGGVDYTGTIHFDPS